MSKKMMLLALSVASAALFAMPAVASATSAHISQTGAFTVAPKGATSLHSAEGDTINCSGGVKGNGNFTTTTTGTLNLTFHGCTTFFGFVSCTSPGQPSGTIATTPLEFHLITPEPKGQHGGVLITPNAATKVFAHFSCAGVQKTVTGNGVIGTIKSPTCGGTSSTATLAFEEGATTGTQKHRLHTGVPYNLVVDGNVHGAQRGEATISFGGNRTLTCT